MLYPGQSSSPQLLLSGCEVRHRDVGLVLGISVLGEILICLPVQRGASSEPSLECSLTEEPRQVQPEIRAKARQRVSSQQGLQRDAGGALGSDTAWCKPLIYSPASLRSRSSSAAELEF